MTYRIKLTVIFNLLKKKKIMGILSKECEYILNKRWTLLKKEKTKKQKAREMQLHAKHLSSSGEIR